MEHSKEYTRIIEIIEHLNSTVPDGEGKYRLYVGGSRKGHFEFSRGFVRVYGPASLRKLEDLIRAYALGYIAARHDHKPELPEE